MFSLTMIITLSSTMIKTSIEQTSIASTLGNENTDSKQLDISEELKNIIFRRIMNNTATPLIEKTDITASPEQDQQEDIQKQDIRNLDIKQFTKSFPHTTRYLIYPNIYNYLRVPAYLYNRYKVPDDPDDSLTNEQINQENLPILNAPTTPVLNMSNIKYDMIIPEQEPHPAYGNEENTTFDFKTKGPDVRIETNNSNIPYKRANVLHHEEEPHPAYGDEEQFTLETKIKEPDVTIDTNTKSIHNILDKESLSAASAEKSQLQKLIVNMSNNNMAEDLLMRTEQRKMQWCIDRRKFLMEMLLPNLQEGNTFCTPNLNISQEILNAFKENLQYDSDKKEQNEINKFQMFQKILLRSQEKVLKQCIQSLNLCENGINKLLNPTEFDGEHFKAITGEELQSGDNIEEQHYLATTRSEESLQGDDQYATSIPGDKSLQESMKPGSNDEPQDNDKDSYELTTTSSNKANENFNSELSDDRNYDDVYALDYPKRHIDETRKSKSINENLVNNRDDEYLSDTLDEASYPSISKEKFDNEIPTVVDEEPNPNYIEESTQPEKYENELEKSIDQNNTSDYNIQNYSDDRTTDDATYYQTDSGQERIPADQYEELQPAKEIGRRHEQNGFYPCLRSGHSGRRNSENKKSTDKETKHNTIDKEPAPIAETTHLDDIPSIINEDNSEEEPSPDYPEDESNDVESNEDELPITTAVNKKVQASKLRSDNNTRSDNDTFNKKISKMDIPQLNIKPKFLKIETVGDLFKYGVIQDNDGLKKSDPKQIFISNDIINKELASPSQLRQIKAFLNSIRRSVNLKVEEDNDQISFESILESKLDDKEELKDSKLLTNDYYKKPVEDINKGAYSIANDLFDLAREGINKINRLDRQVESEIMKQQMDGLDMEPEPKIIDLT